MRKAITLIVVLFIVMFVIHLRWPLDGKSWVAFVVGAVLLGWGYGTWPKEDAS